MYKDEIWSRETQERYVEGVLNAVLGTAFELGLEEDSCNGIRDRIDQKLFRATDEQFGVLIREMGEVFEMANAKHAADLETELEEMVAGEEIGCA